MVVEFLTFDVPSEERAAWLRRDTDVWTAFLERQPGFVRKERWLSDESNQVHAVIWWESLDHWKAIGAEQVAAVDAQMGRLAVEPICRTFPVVADRPDTIGR